jgi:hypothetical protein
MLAMLQQRKQLQALVLTMQGQAMSLLMKTVTTC